MIWQKLPARKSWLITRKIETLPERRGNRMTADVITEKTQALGWNAEHSVADYIEELRSMSWGNVQ